MEDDICEHHRTYRQRMPMSERPIFYRLNDLRELLKSTHMILNGASLPVIQRFLGHESIQTTEAYLDIGSEAMTKAVEEAGKLIFKDTPEKTVSSWKSPDILRRLKGMVK